MIYTLDQMLKGATYILKGNENNHENNREKLVSNIKDQLPKREENMIGGVKGYIDSIYGGDKNICILSKEEVDKRKKTQKEAVDTLVNFVAKYEMEYKSIERSANDIGGGVFLDLLYKVPKVSDNVIDESAEKKYNDELRESVRNKNFKRLGQLYDQYIKDLPGYDSVSLLNISDEEAPKAFVDFYPLIVASLYVEDILKKFGGDDFWGQLTPESKKRLEQLSKDAVLFDNLKKQCDKILHPYYPYIDIDKIISEKDNVDILGYSVYSVEDDWKLEILDTKKDRKTVEEIKTDLNYVLALGMLNKDNLTIKRKIELQLEDAGINPENVSIRDLYGKEYTFNNDDQTIKRKIERQLKDAGINPENVLVRDLYGKEYTLTREVKDYRATMQPGVPLFFNDGDKTKIYVLKDGFPEEMSLDAAANLCSEKLDNAVQTAGNLLNSWTAAPPWLRITGSKQYERMQEVFAKYQEVACDKKGMKRLRDAKKVYEDMKSRAVDYLVFKEVYTDKYPDFDSFKSSKRYGRMNRTEAARMEAAYSMLAAYKVAGMCLELSNRNTWKGYSCSYKHRVELDNKKIEYYIDGNKTFSDGKGKEDSEVEKKLQGELKNALFSNGGLLGKNVFTIDDREIVRDIWVKAVALRVFCRYRYEGIEVDEGLSESIIKKIEKASAEDVNLREAVKKCYTPDGLRRFFTEFGVGKIAKELYENMNLSQLSQQPPSQKQPPQQQLSPQRGEGMLEII